MKVISVFGSARPRAGTPDYVLAETVGRLLAEAGYAVATGGYSGAMEGVSKGANLAGGHVIGVTTAQLERIRPIPPNQYVIENIAYPTFWERLVHVVKHNDGMIALPGGVGTLGEIILAWEFFRVQEIPLRPLVLLGGMWRETMASFVQDAYIDARSQRMVQFADSAEEAVQLIINRAK